MNKEKKIKRNNNNFCKKLLIGGIVIAIAIGAAYLILHWISINFEIFKCFLYNIYYNNLSKQRIQIKRYYNFMYPYYFCYCYYC